MIWLREQSRKGLLGKWIIADWNSEAHETTRQCATICNTKSQHASWSPCYCITLLILLCWDRCSDLWEDTLMLRFLSSPNRGASWLPWTLLLRCLHPWSSLSPSSPYWNNWLAKVILSWVFHHLSCPLDLTFPTHSCLATQTLFKALHQIWIPSQTTPRLKPYDQLTIPQHSYPSNSSAPADLQAFRFLPL